MLNIISPLNYNILLSSHIFIKNESDKKMIIEQAWEILNAGYAKSGLEFLSFISKEHMIDDSFLWKIVYDGKLDNLKEFDITKCYAMGVYKQKFGLKRVGACTNSFSSNKQFRFDAWLNLVTDDFKKAWVECSHNVEKNLLKYGGKKYIIDPNILKENHVFEDIDILDDGIHYKRHLFNNNTEVTKIAIGTIKI